MADKSSSIERNGSLMTSGNNASAAATDSTDSTEKFKRVHRHKRQKAMNGQGWREWQAASTRSNSLRVGPDGIVRRASGGAAASSGCSSKSGGGYGGGDDKSAGIGTSESGEMLGSGTEATRYSSLPPKPMLEPATRSAQKRKVDWSEEYEDTADAVVPAAGDIPILTSAHNRGSSITRSDTTVAQKSGGLKSYENVHPSRIGNLGLGDARLCTDREQEGLQHRFLKNVNISNKEIKGNIKDDLGSADLGRCAASQDFPGIENETASQETGPYGTVNCIDITTREASLRRREVLLEISEQSVMNSRTQVLRSIEQAFEVLIEVRDVLKFNLSSILPYYSSPGSPPWTEDHHVRSCTNIATGAIEDATGCIVQFEKELLSIERVLTGRQPDAEN